MAAFGLSEELHARIAEQLYDAERNVAPIQFPSREYPVITYGDAYAIQKAGLKLRQAEGAEVVGRKIGITSKGMMEQLNCTSPDYGYLLGSTQVPEGGSCVRSELHLPLVECELGFRIGETLDSNFVTADDVCHATECVMPCFEVVDTRFVSWEITVRDTICDNAACARFMVSSATKKLDEIDPSTIALTCERNGESLGGATGAEILDSSPIASVVWLANRLIEYGDCLRAGDIVLSGAFMRSTAAVAGDTFTLHMDGFPPLTMGFV